MSALDELKKKNPFDMTMLEFIVTQAEYSQISGNAEHAASELACKDAELLALRERVAKLEKVEECAKKLVALRGVAHGAWVIEELEAALKSQ
jgi:hypothetical protein